MSSGKRYCGQPIDRSSRRGITIVPRQSQSSLRAAAPRHAALIAQEDRSVVVDDFYHEGGFWRAVVPLHGVDRVAGQAFNFSKPRTRQGPNGPEILFDHNGLPKKKLPWLNHLQCRFVLKGAQAVRLYPQEVSATGEPVHQIRDFVYTVDAVGPVGVTFNLRDGLAGNLFSAHRFLSTREMVFERIVVGGQTLTESPPLPLNEQQKRALLTRSLLRSHYAGANEPYYLYRCCRTNNCTSNPFQILDQVMDYSLLQRISSLLYRLPFNPRFYLRLRGLDADPNVRKLLRDEFADYIHDPETQQRKRDTVREKVRAQRAARTVREKTP
jgi:hypothetical protein